MPTGLRQAAVLLVTAAALVSANTTVRFGALSVSNFPAASSALRLAVEYVNENQLVPNVIASSLVSTGLSLPQIAPEATDPTLGNSQQFPQLVRISWPDSVLSKALIDLLEHFGWDQMSIFVSNDAYGTHGLAVFQLIAGQKKWVIHTMQSFDPTENPADIEMRSQLRVIKQTGARIIVLHCQARYAAEILREASAMGMTGQGWAWVVSDGITGHAHDAFKPTSGAARVPGYLQGLVGPVPPAARGRHSGAFLAKWRAADPATYPGAGEPDIGVQTDGVTGYIDFDSAAARVNAEYNIVNLKSGGWQKVGMWNLSSGLHMYPDEDVTLMGGATTVYPYVSDLSNRTLRVVTKAAPGFVMIADVAKDGKNVSGNDRFQGFCVDLFSWLSSQLGFRYEYYHVTDGHYGVYDSETGKWTGLVGDVLSGEADIAVSALSITSERQAVADFTLPIHDNGIALVMKKAQPRNSAVWTSFLTTTTEPYRSLGIAMLANKDAVLVDTDQEAFDKVRQGKYALFGDSALMDYEVSHEPCDLQTIGRLFWQTGYGLLLPKNSKYTTEFNKAIVAAKEQGIYDELETKWIKSKECSGASKSALDSSVIGLQDMLGVFVLVYGGMALALVLLVGEFIYACAQDVKASDAGPQTVPEAVKARLKSMFVCGQRSSNKN
uniref:Ionotropic glutamate receptor L-glutamate and glycine-binding domain-containing protein n=1 Tax=Branchiostoma floridae TaxID=7739 RepID=C3XWT4_BRAFL|eukprot:XP_002611184.1 hypothetical protein BRAFLDRAFT_88417 [Branchiostoma floridae]